MNELQITELTQNSITNWDFAAIKLQLESGLKKYDIVYTDEKEAKADKSELNKIKNAIEDRRKEYKKECLKPYNIVEAQVKELVTMIDKRTEHIDEAVKEYKAKKEKEKLKEVKAFYDKQSADLGEYAEPLFGVFLKNSKWLQVSHSMKQCREEIVLAVSKAKRETDRIKASGSPFVSALLDSYAKGMSMEDILKQNDELITATKLANINLSSPPVVPQKEVTADKENGTILMVYASKRQLESLIDFMNAIGIEYELS